MLPDLPGELPEDGWFVGVGFVGGLFDTGRLAAGPDEVDDVSGAVRSILRLGIRNNPLIGLRPEMDARSAAFDHHRTIMGASNLDSQLACGISRLHGCVDRRHEFFEHVLAKSHEVQVKD